MYEDEQRLTLRVAVIGQVSLELTRAGQMIFGGGNEGKCDAVDLKRETLNSDRHSSLSNVCCWTSCMTSVVLRNRNQALRRNSGLQRCCFGQKTT